MITTAAPEQRTQTVFEVASATDVGLVREHNEDSHLCYTFRTADTNPLGLTALLLVADGLGGHAAGEIASGAVKQAFQRAFIDAQTQALDALPADARDATHLLIKVVEGVNSFVHEFGRAAGRHRPGTTLTACLLFGNHYIIGHVGDSRAYLITTSGARQVTDDDSWVAEAVRTGALTEEQARRSPLRSQITRCIGTNEYMAPAIYEGTLASNEAVLLCTDGLTEYYDAASLAAAFHGWPSLAQTCAELIEGARQLGGHDNITAVLARTRQPDCAASQTPFEHPHHASRASAPSIEHNATPWSQVRLWLRRKK